ncbi:MAG: hypothetical protein ACYSWW_04575 [Planctomycetota bacterium]
MKKAKKMNGDSHHHISYSQIYVLFDTLFQLVLSLESIGLGPSTIRLMHRIRKGVVYLLNKLMVRDYIDGGDSIEKPVSRSLKDLSDWELQFHDLLNAVLKHIVQCHLKESTPSDAAKELEKLAQRAQRLAGGSGDDFPLCLRTMTDDLRKLTDHVAVVGTKASGIPFIAASVSMAFSVVYADVAVEFRPNGSATQRSERSMTADELRTRDIVAGVKHLLDNIRDYTPEDCVKRLQAFSDRLDKCPEVAKYSRRADVQTKGIGDALAAVQNGELDADKPRCKSTDKTSGDGAKKRRGPKRRYSPEDDKELSNVWERARDSGVSKADFCEDNKMTSDNLDRCLARVRKAKSG